MCVCVCMHALIKMGSYNGTTMCQYWDNRYSDTLLCYSNDQCVDTLMCKQVILSACSFCLYLAHVSSC